VLDAVIEFADRSLGKGVVVAKDSPGFIGNHLALYGMSRILATLESGGYTIEEIDEITGPAIGRPKSATFRTLDLAGLDIVGHVMHDLQKRLPDPEARAVFVLPPFVEQMLAKGVVGEKAGQGFYKRVKGAGGESEILTIDRSSLEYVAKKPARLPSLESARTLNDVGERIKTLFNGSDRVGQFLRETLAPTLVYAAHVTPSIAHSADDIDRVMRWGFGWDLGPFEIADAIGIDRVIEVARQVSPKLLDKGVPELWKQRTKAVPSELEILKNAKDQSRIVKKNAGASLVDIGDGVLAIEFHSKMNAIGADTLQMLQAGVREAERNFVALVVGNDAPHFSAGANLMLLLLEAQEENWDDIDLIIRQFQQSTMGLRYSKVPVIVAPAGLALGGGCEVCLHGDRV
jgi:3-hydroxyacyl-CoA dehydrogenase